MPEVFERAYSGLYCGHIEMDGYVTCEVLLILSVTTVFFSLYLSTFNVALIMNPKINAKLTTCLKVKFSKQFKLNIFRKVPGRGAVRLGVYSRLMVTSVRPCLACQNRVKYTRVELLSQ